MQGLWARQTYAIQSKGDNPIGIKIMSFALDQRWVFTNQKATADQFLKIWLAFYKNDSSHTIEEMGGFVTTANSHSRAIGVAYLSFSSRGDKQGFERKEHSQSLQVCCCTWRRPPNLPENSQLWAGKQLFREGTERLQPTGRKSFKCFHKVEKAVQNHSRYSPVFLI